MPRYSWQHRGRQLLDGAERSWPREDAIAQCAKCHCFWGGYSYRLIPSRAGILVDRRTGRRFHVAAAGSWDILPVDFWMDSSGKGPVLRHRARLSPKHECNGEIRFIRNGGFDE